MGQPASLREFLEVGDLAAEVGAQLAPPATIQKVRYTHIDMIDFIISNPGCRQKDLAARYGYTESWVSTVMSSDAFKAAFAARRNEVVDPELTASVNERFEALTRRSLERLMAALDRPNVSDTTLLRAAELGAKALGVGGNAPPRAPESDHLAQLANRLIDLQSTVRKGNTYNGQSKDVTEVREIPAHAEGE